MLVELYRALANRSPGRPNGSWRQKYEQQEAMFRERVYFDRTQLVQQAQPEPEAA